MKKLEADCFGGKNAEALNVLMSALFRAAGGKENVYEYLETTPKTTFIVELFDALTELGYKIAPL